MLLCATSLRVLLEPAFVMIVVAAPKLVEDVLETAPENTVYVVAPGAIGIAACLLAAPLLAKLASASLALWVGFALTIMTIFGLSLFIDVAKLLDEQTFLPLSQLQETFEVRREIATTMLILPVGGFGVRPSPGCLSSRGLRARLPELSRRYSRLNLPSAAPHRP